MTLQTKIDNRSAVVGVIGLGYVGLPLCRAFWGAGFKVPPRLPGAARWIRPTARAVPTAALAPPVRITAVVGPTGPTAG